MTRFIYCKASSLVTLIAMSSTLTISSLISADTTTTTTTSTSPKTTMSPQTQKQTPTPPPSSSSDNSNEESAAPSSSPTSAPAAADTAFTHEEMLKLSEAFGNFIGKNLNNPGVKFDLDSVVKGIRNGASGAPSPMSDQEYEKMMVKLQENAYKQLSEDNLKAANDFLVKNKNAEGVIEIEPGKLQYQVLEQGTGPAVETGNTPQIKYMGKYLDGTVFGNSDETGGPITVPLNQTIEGLARGLIGMKEGEKRRLFVHPDLGYGTMGQLPPNAMLIFDIELVKANAPSQKPRTLSEMLQAQQFDISDEDSDDDDYDFDDDEDADDENEREAVHQAMKGKEPPPASPVKAEVKPGSQQQQQRPQSSR